MSCVLVDTSVWIDHFRQGNEMLLELLAFDRVMVHPLIIGEVACGTPPRRTQLLADLSLLQQTKQASVRETMVFIEQEHLFGQGCGLIDLVLLASTLITPGVELWTLDKRLSGMAERFNVLHQPKLH